MIDIHFLLALHSSLQQDYVVASGVDKLALKEIISFCEFSSIGSNLNPSFIHAACISYNIYLKRPFDSWNDLVAIRTAMAIIEESGRLLDSYSLSYGFFESFENSQNPTIEIAFFFEKHSKRDLSFLKV